MHQIIKNYRDNDKLRKSFNTLAEKTFGINFEDWYQNGYWTERYNPHSIVVDEKVVANVSVNRTPFAVNGEIKNYIQLGTVMTDKEYRNRGLIREIMEDIFREYGDQAEGIYLFAGDAVHNFYPKFGFSQKKQYEYVRKISESKDKRFQKISMRDKAAWDSIQEKIQNSYHQSAFEMLDNSQLNMFYITKYMQENVFYSEELDTYVVAECEDGTAVISMVISDREQDLVRIVEGFGPGINEVKLGFTPKNTKGFVLREVMQEDTTLFMKGNLDIVEEEKLMFPLLAHA